MKSDTEEKYLQQVNRVIDYINSHLNEPLRVETLAREVCLSEYHFHRIMRAYLHEPHSLKLYLLCYLAIPHRKTTF